jgi:hypothetical protein
MYTPGQLTRQLADDYRANAGSRLLSYNPNNPNALGHAGKCFFATIQHAFFHYYRLFDFTVELRNLNEESAAITLKKLMTLTRPEVEQRKQLAEMETQLGIRSPPK